MKKIFPSTAGIKDQETKQAIDALIRMIQTESRNQVKGKKSLFGDPINLRKGLNDLIARETGILKDTEPASDDIEIVGDDAFIWVNNESVKGKRKYRINFKDNSTANSNGEGTRFFGVCKITGAPTGGVYPVDVYTDQEGDLIGSGHAKPVRLHISDTIATGKWCIGASTDVEFLPGD